jgi:hypothetical protein
MSVDHISQLLPLIGFFLAWLVLMRWVLPRLGVST